MVQMEPGQRECLNSALSQLIRILHLVIRVPLHLEVSDWVCTDGIIEKN